MRGTRRSKLLAAPGAALLAGPLCGAALAVSAAAAGPLLSAASCPDREPAPPLRSERAGASTQLVPAGQSTVLLCRYAGLNGPGPRLGLLSAVPLADGTTVDDLASQLNALSSGPSGPVACPSDDASQVVALFGYASGPDDPVTVSLSGCTAATDGLLSRLATPRLIERLESLAPVPALATVLGVLRVCGGPAPGGCHVGSFTDCEAGRGCAATDRVRVLGRHGRTVLTVELKRGRFRARLAPGSYRLELLEDGSTVHGRVAQTTTASPSAGASVSVSFEIAVP